MTFEELTKNEAQKRAKEYATPISDLVNPSDIDGGVERWESVKDEKLERELHKSVDIILSEITYHNKLRDIIYTRAITIHKEETMRVPKEDMAMKDDKMLLSQMYWPYKMTNMECIATLQEIYPTLKDVPTQDYQEARNEISKALTEGMKPKA